MAERMAGPRKVAVSLIGEWRSPEHGNRLATVHFVDVVEAFDREEAKNLGRAGVEARYPGAKILSVLIEVVR